MPLTVKMIASDLDGTLFNSNHRLSVRTVEAVQAATEAGIKVVAATGRSTTSAIPLLQAAETISMAACSNGSLLHDLASDTTIKRFPIAHTHVGQLFATLSELDHQLSFCWETDRGNGWDETFDDIAFQHADLGSERGLARRPSSAEHTTKIMVRHPHLSPDTLRQHLIDNLAHPLTVSCSGVQFVEITGVNVSKATTLQHVCTEWGIEASEVVAFGDNNNDIDMLRWAGHGVAVANATNAVRLNADEVIGHHNNDAVAEAIERIVATTLTS